MENRSLVRNTTQTTKSLTHRAKTRKTTWTKSLPHWRPCWSSVQPTKLTRTTIRRRPVQIQHASPIGDVLDKVVEPMDVDVTPKAHPVQSAVNTIYVEGSQCAASAGETRDEPMEEMSPLRHAPSKQPSIRCAECSRPAASTSKTWSTGGFELNNPTGNFFKNAFVSHRRNLYISH